MLNATLIHVNAADCHHETEGYQSADGGLHIRRLKANIPNKQKPTADKECSSSFGANNSSQEQLVTKCYKGLRIWTVNEPSGSIKDGGFLDRPSMYMDIMHIKLKKSYTKHVTINKQLKRYIYSLT